MVSPALVALNLRRRTRFGALGNDRDRNCEDLCMRSSRVRIQPYIPAHLAKQLRVYAAAQGSSESSVVHAALNEYLDRDRNERDLLMRRLDRNTVGISEVRRDVAIVAEALGTFARAWFAVAAIPGATGDAEARRRQARGAYEQLVQRVAKSCMAADGLMARVLAERPATSTDD